MAFFMQSFISFINKRWDDAFLACWMTAFELAILVAMPQASFLGFRREVLPLKLPVEEACAV